MSEKENHELEEGLEGEEFGELIKYTGGGFAAGILSGALLDHFGFQSSGIGQWIVRTLSGEGESIFGAALGTVLDFVTLYATHASNRKSINGNLAAILLFDRNPIAMTWWRGYDEKGKIHVTAIKQTMGRSGGHNKAFLGTQDQLFVFKFHDGLPGEDEEELLRVLVIMAGFGPTRRHPLLGDAESGRFQQVPTVANPTPGVMLAIFFADRFHGSSLL